MPGAERRSISGAGRGSVEGAVAVAALAWAGLLAGTAPARAGDARLDAGATVRIAARPRNVPLKACSRGETVCIHAAEGVQPALIWRTLRAAQEALSGLLMLGMPAPLPDGYRGTGMGLDIYLMASSTLREQPQSSGNISRLAMPQPEISKQLGAQAYADSAHVMPVFQRSSAFVVVPATAVAGCRWQADITRGVAQAILLGLDAAQHESTLGMHSSYLASVLTPCATLEADAVDRYQRTPARGLLGARLDRSHGSLLFPWLLDEIYGSGRPGGVMNAIISISVDEAPKTPMTRRNEPDIFDAFRKLLPARKQRLGDLLLEYAVARAFVGDRNDGFRLGDTRRYGAFGRVRFEWSVPASTLPRRLAPLRPVLPTGSSYIWIDGVQSLTKSGIEVVAHWEESFVFKWALIALDSAGRKISQSDAGGVFGRSSAQLSLTNLEGAAAVLLVGANLGNDDRANPFDPDSGEPREASYNVTLRAL